MDKNFLSLCPSLSWPFSYFCGPDYIWRSKCAPLGHGCYKKQVNLKPPLTASWPRPLICSWPRQDADRKTRGSFCVADPAVTRPVLLLVLCVLHNSVVLNLTGFAEATGAKADSSTLRDLFSQLYFEFPRSAAQTGTFCPAQQSAGPTRPFTPLLAAAALRPFWGD